MLAIMLALIFGFVYNLMYYLEGKKIGLSDWLVNMFAALVIGFFVAVIPNFFVPLKSGSFEKIDIVAPSDLGVSGKFLFVSPATYPTRYSYWYKDPVSGAETNAVVDLLAGWAPPSARVFEDASPDHPYVIIGSQTCDVGKLNDFIICLAPLITTHYEFHVPPGGVEPATVLK